MKILSKNLLLSLLALGLLASCKKELDTYYTPQGAPGFFNLGILGTTLNTTFNTKYAPGETIPVTAIYNQSDNLNTITVFQATKTDSAQVGSYSPGGTTNTYSQALQSTAQLVPYVVPTTYANGTAVRVDVTLGFQNGGQRLRRFTYTVANAPTLVFGTPVATYRNGLGASAQLEGDLVGYSLVLNAGGVSTLPAPAATPTAPLFKNVDSLVYYAQLGAAGPLLRQGVVRTPTAGVENRRTIDVRLPAGSLAAGSVSFVFKAYAQATVATLTAPPLVATGAPALLRSTRPGRVSFGGGLTTDSLAFNLVTGANEPATNPVAGKDLQVSGLASTGVLTLNTPNTTRYYKLTAAQLAATPYATATANAVSVLLSQNTPAADLGTPAVGDVYAVRLRGTTEVMLLRILALRPSTNGSIGRVRFEYRSQ